MGLSPPHPLWLLAVLSCHQGPSSILHRAALTSGKAVWLGDNFQQLCVIRGILRRLTGPHKEGHASSTSSPELSLSGLVILGDGS